MSHAALHSPPRTGEVLREQIRAVALALRPPAIGVGVLLVLATSLTIAEFITGGGPVDFAPELSMIPGVLGALFPIGVWKGENRFGLGFLWTLPVDRARHALVKVAAGWVCLMVTVLVFLAWFLILALVTGGNFLDGQTVQLLPSEAIPAPRSLDPAALTAVRYTPEPILWLAPFSAATGTYVLASAFALGTRYPVRWLIGVVLTFLVASALGAAAGIDWLRLIASNVLEGILEGRYGLDALLTARAESLKTVVTLSTGKAVGVWRALPDVGDWALATALWIGAGALALLAAASRHAERARPRKAASVASSSSL